MKSTQIVGSSKQRINFSSLPPVIQDRILHDEVARMNLERHMEIVGWPGGKSPSEE